MAAPTINSGSFPVNFAVPVGQVRLLVGDTDPEDASLDIVSGTGSFAFFGDAEIEAFIALHGSPQRAAAAILRAVAVSQALKLKKWTSADLAVDGPAISTALLAAARACEDAASADLAASGVNDYFELGRVGGATHHELRGLL